MAIIRWQALPIVKYALLDITVYLKLRLLLNVQTELIQDKDLHLVYPVLRENSVLLQKFLSLITVHQAFIQI